MGDMSEEYESFKETCASTGRTPLTYEQYSTVRSRGLLGVDAFEIADDLQMGVHSSFEVALERYAAKANIDHYS